MVRSDMGDSKDFKVRSPLLVAVVMDMVSKETMEGLPWELLYVDDLVLTAPSEAELQRKVKEWREY